MNTNPLKEFGKRLKNYRINKSMSKKELSKILNRNERTISNWESGQSLPATDKLIKMMKLFDVDPRYLFEPFIGAEDTEFTKIYNKLHLIQGDPASLKILQKFFEILDVWTEEIEKRGA